MASEEAGAEPAPERWRPLHTRADAEAAVEYDALREGVPPWLDRSLWRWMRDRVTGDMSIVHRAERKLQAEIDTYDAGAGESIERYWVQATGDQRLALVDFLLHDLEDARQRWREMMRTDRVEDCQRAVVHLAQILAESSSAWMVAAEPRWGLTRRLNETTTEAFRTVAALDTDAAALIKMAWNACYRFRPNFDVAYRHAVHAVESAATPQFAPNDPTPSLGKMIPHLRDTRAEWTVATLDARQIASSDALLAMMQLLWHNDQRHVKEGGEMPSGVTGPEAGAAVSLAVTLVQWFSAGHVHGRSPDAPTR